MNRRQEREQAFIIVFEKEFNPELNVDEIFEAAIEAEVVENTKFTKTLISTVADKCEIIDNKIQEVSIGWDKNRISKVVLAILRLAICEIMFLEDVPISVSINEAVELSKKFAGEKDTTFVNGILGTVAKEQEVEQN